MRRLVLALSTALACTLAAPGHAATISWDTDADGDWNTAGNWNPATLPGAGDDAVIDRAGANGAPPTVTHSAGATAVGSLTNNEAVAVVGGSSITTGDLSAAEGASLDVSAGASFAATGGVSVDGLSLDAQSGGRIDLSSMASYVGSATPSVTWRAQGQDAAAASRIDASGATSLSGAVVAGRLWQVEALAGAEIDLSGATSLADSNASFLADGAGSLVDLSSLDAFTDTIQTIQSSLEARDGGELRLRNDAAANLSIAGYRVVRDGASSALDSSRLTSLTSSTVQVLGTGTSLDLSNLASYDTNSFQAFDGALLTLDTPSYAAAGGNGLSRFFTAAGADGGPSRIDGSSIATLTGATTAGRILQVEARDGGAVDLANVTTLLDSNASFLADGAGSLVDLSSVEAFTDTVQTIQSSLEARDGGELRLRNDAAANLSIDRYSVVRDGPSSTLDTSRVTSLTSSTVQVLGAGTSLDLSNLTSYDTNSFQAFDGAVLSLDTPSYTATGGNGLSRFFSADGADGGPSRIDGSSITTLTGATTAGRILEVEARDGGVVDLANVTMLVDSNASFLADGAGSLVDLSSLDAFTDTIQTIQSTLEARDGGELRLRNDAAASLSIDRYSVVRDGASSTLDTSRVTSLTSSTVQAIGDGTTLDLTNLMSYDTNSFQAFDGAVLTLDTPSYTATGGDGLSRIFSADGAGGGPSRIDGSSITTLTGATTTIRILEVEARDGGVIDLANVTTLVDSNVTFLANGAGSLVDLSSLEAFADTVETIQSSLEARDGGEVRLRNDVAANLTIDGYRVVRDGASSTLDTSRVTSLTNSTAQVIGAGTTLDLGSLGSFDTNSFQAFDGAVLTLDTASYSAAGGNGSSRFFTADGANGGPSRIDGSSITTLTGGTTFGRILGIEALDGGQIDLGNATSLTGDATLLAEGAGSLADLRALASFDASGGSTLSRIQALDGGLVQLRENGVTQLTDVDLFATQSGTIQGDTVEALGASRVRGIGSLALNELVNEAFLAPGLADNDPGQITLTGGLTQTALGVFDLDIGGLLADEFDRVMVLGEAVLAGEIQVTFVELDASSGSGAFDPQIGDSFDVLTAASILDTGLQVTGGLSDGREWRSQIVSVAGGEALRLLVVVPEPSTFSLVALGLLVAARARRRR